MAPKRERILTVLADRYTGLACETRGPGSSCRDRYNPRDYLQWWCTPCLLRALTGIAGPLVLGGGK